MDGGVAHSMHAGQFWLCQAEQPLSAERRARHRVELKPLDDTEVEKQLEGKKGGGGRRKWDTHVLKGE